MRLPTPIPGRAFLPLATLVALVGALLIHLPSAHAAGTLTPVGATQKPIEILDHHADVVIDNGFARTEVLQTFFNPNDTDLEAIYAFPVPRDACLSEVTVYISENEIHGEVLPRAKAEQLYNDEKSKGGEAGLATKNGYQTFEFRVSPVRAQAETKLRFVYYQPLEIDTSVGRYVYPLEDGGTDELAKSFWTSNETVQNTFSMDVEVKSAAPIDALRIPGFESAAKIDQLDAGHFKAHIEQPGATLSKDVVVYYKLAENQPGRVELIPYRADPDKPGTFLMVVTPGLDLGPITGGADYIFVLDTSGSMQAKLATLARGVEQAIGNLSSDDRFRIVAFNTNAQEITRGWTPATQENVQKATQLVQSLRATGSTNLYAGLNLALKDLDDDRATSLIMVTDGVTNTGIIDPKSFHDLMSKYDIRVFGFLMGNSANWPLVKLICDTSGGFYSAVSNSDDIIGQILLAKSKVTYECLHDADLSISGVKVFDTTRSAIGKVYRGQQLLMFGRYDKPGKATLTLKARMTGQDKTYQTTFDFPAIDTDNPEIERLWAMNRVEAIQADEMVGRTPVAEAKHAIEDLGVQYQLVTDETAMVVLADDVFERNGIERRNRDRTAIEHQAQAQRRAQPVRNNRVDTQQPMFSQPAPSPGNGGGALDPFSALIVLSLGGVAAQRRRPSSRRPARARSAA